MKKINELFDLIKQSDVTLIGYTFKDEKIKDELISNFDYVEIKEINSSFSFKSFLRREKLNQVLDNQKKFDYILLDLNNILPTEYNSSRVAFTRNVIEEIREGIYRDYSSDFPTKPQYKIILTSPLNKSIGTDEVGSFVGGNQPIYMSDLVVVIKEDIAKVIKNRNAVDGDYILYNTKQVVEI